jgi:hypothetical protein
LDPDLVRVSGRESLEPADRVGLLEADLMWLVSTMPKYEQGTDYGVFDRAHSSTVHALNQTVGAIREVSSRWQRFAALPGRTPENARAWADAAISPVECDVLALRRGGASEFHRIRWARRGSK